MCGVLTGTLPQTPQQNMFLGIPLQLMIEEVTLLVGRGAAIVIGDVKAHEDGLARVTDRDRRSEEAQVAARAKAEIDEWKRQEAERIRKRKLIQAMDVKDQDAAVEAALNEMDPSRIPHSYIMPALSSDCTYLPTSLPSLPAPEQSRLAVYRYLWERGYYLSPGLRFGAQFMAYPGDPLRYHSHFLVNGIGWEEEFDVMDVVSGGRLGTGVKKAWVLGGEDHSTRTVHCYAVEWAGFG